MSINVKVEFTGGLELIMKDKAKQATVTLPALTDGEPTTIRQVILYVRDNLVADKPQLFSTDDTVRPGVLVMINDSDWEVEGDIAYQVQDKDEVIFISTMHGG
ncbi:Ubiquitin- modifier 1 [Linderina macrospora]|uniref:Ubiquitin- modifier 1 n=1 Tax=Linderina macrospora TaxID=4868 RepID=A0ACC1JG07_9FUNG|nr:Ubiquitin- modifier 1 [Linderina macrospora]